MVFLYAGKFLLFKLSRIDLQFINNIKVLSINNNKTPECTLKLTHLI